MAKLLQPSFGGGEYAPELYGRTDLARFGISGRTVRNWRVRPQGGLEARRGSRFVCEVANSANLTRGIPFAVSETLAYSVLLGHLTARFLYNGALVESSPGVPYEIATPWTSAMLRGLRYTQSADTLFVAHGDAWPRVIKRTSPTTFSIALYASREGPFRSVNSNSSLLIAASAKTGTVTLTTNFDLFDPGLLGTLIHMEPEALGQIVPWMQGERSPGLGIGSVRQSDGKYYRCTQASVPTGGALNFVETGNVRPEHELGREWDGAGTTKSDGTTTWRTGVEWEYLHSGYGVVEITSITDLRTAVGIVRRTLPEQLVGGLGAPSQSWTLSGDGTALSFLILGASSTSQLDYQVSIGGTPVQSDPNYTPPGGNGGTGGTGGGGGYGGGESSTTYVP